MTEEITILILKGWIPVGNRYTVFPCFLCKDRYSDCCEIIYRNSISLKFERHTASGVSDIYQTIKWEDIPADYINEFIRLANE